VSLLLDTNGLVCLADRREPEHLRIRRILETTDESLIVPVTVLPEVDYFISRRVGAASAVALLQDIVDGELRLEQLLPTDLPRCIELMRQYADSNIGFVDASIVAIAERLGVRRILTLDRRHFGIIRPRHCDAFTLLP